MKGLGHRGLHVIYQKELKDHFRSKRFMIILILIALVGLASIYSAGYGIHQAVNQENGEFVFLQLFSSSGSSLPSFVSFISFLGPLVGLALGFDAMNRERASGTLSRLLAQPIHRDTVINGKFLAGVSVIALMLLSLGLAIGGLGLWMLGIPPTFEELMRIGIFILFTIFYISLWLAVSLLFSLLFRQAATSALAGIALWLFLSVFVGLLSGVIADVMFPLDEQASADMILKNQQWRMFIHRLSPAQLYNEATITILNPGIRTLGPVLTYQLEGAVPGMLPLGQSILLVWPHLTVLIAATLICFAISYIYFMKQEIRAT